MKTPSLDPDIADVAPAGTALTEYDQQHVITYMRLLDAEQQGADWGDVARVVLRIDPETEANRARRAFESHLSRARWFAEQGYRQLLLLGARSP